MTGPAVSETSGTTVRVWDPMVRIFHWSLAICFLVGYALGDDGGSLHRMLGYAVLGLVAFRVIWGVVGGRHARFSDFVPRPAVLRQYLRDVLAGREARYLGHNPAGGAMIVLLLTAVTATGISGWLMTTDAFWGVEWMEEGHEALAAATLALVGLHIAGVVFSSLRHRENLVRAMITGRKRA
jgi:cytochrome b